MVLEFRVSFSKCRCFNVVSKCGPYLGGGGGG